jgi:hypothetical protein
MWYYFRMKSFISSWLIWSGVSVLLAIIAIWVQNLIGFGIDSNLVMWFFPGVWGFYSGTTPQAILSFIIFTAVYYLIPGLVFAVIYKLLQKHCSNRKAFLITVCVPIAIIIGLSLIDYQNYRNFFHVGATPEDCAALDEDEQGWCYRNIYREYSIPQVCSHPELGSEDGSGEAEECARRYGAQSGNVAACSAFQGKPLYDDCRWGVAIITKDKSLCEQLPADDGQPEHNVMSSRKMCNVVIDEDWKNNADFYLHGR